MTSPSSISVSNSTYALTRLASHHTATWKWMGNMESKLLSYALRDIPIKSPIYIAGLARSGSTILLEMLAQHPDTASHIHRDFPFIFTPCWWNFSVRKTTSRPSERAHGDGIMVNEDSPEAFEEILWMEFFGNAHNAKQSNVLGEETNNSDFETFYTNHIKKVIHIRKAPRYLAKANYNATRLAYLHKLFPDAKFIIPVRSPVSHVESLTKQHQRFTKAGAEDPRVASQMSATGHFEFGLHRLPIHTGDNESIQHTLQHWERGEDALGYAHQWAAVYGYIQSLLKLTPSLAKQTQVIRYEDLCHHPKETLEKIFTHCELQTDKTFLGQQSSLITSPPKDSKFSIEEQDKILKICDETAKLYGYG